jgi:hypothetical protein
LDQLTKLLIEKGDIEGLLLTGIGSGAMELLKNYLNRTGDVQSVALLCCYGGLDVLRDERMDFWVSWYPFLSLIYSYQGLLNQWKMYKVRAKYDIARKALFPIGMEENGKSLALLSLKCQFCKAIVSGHTFSRKSATFSNVVASGMNAAKITKVNND